MESVEIQKSVIIQCSPNNSASVILCNILYGLITEKEPIKYIQKESINDIKQYIDSVQIPILKTHICVIDSWINLIKGYNLFFICSENNKDKIEDNYRQLKNTVIIPARLLIITRTNTVENIVDIVYNKCTNLLPNTIIMNKGNAIKRVISMYEMYNTIKDKPFTYYDPFYHIHGSHNQKERIFEEQRVLVVSPGGCACTSLIKFLKPYLKTINCPDDTDKIKHTLPRSNLIKKYNPTHIIYLFGDIIKAVRSLFRRNYSYVHYYKLHNIALNSSKCPFTNYKSYINNTLNNNCEPMGIMSHYNAWKDIPNVFFIHYEDINKSELFNKYLELPEGTHKKFILKERKSTANSLESEKYLSILNNITEEMMKINNTCNPQRAIQSQIETCP